MESYELVHVVTQQTRFVPVNNIPQHPNYLLCIDVLKNTEVAQERRNTYTAAYTMYAHEHINPGRR